MILIVILYALFGLSLALTKLILDYAHPLFIVGTRMTIAGIILMGYIGIRHRTSCYPRSTHIKYYLQLAFFMIFLPHISRTWAIQYTPILKAGLLFNLAPFFTALLAYFINGDRLKKLQFIALVIGFTGMIPILLTGSPLEGSFINFISWPELAIVVAVASRSYGVIVLHKLVAHLACPPYLANSISMLLGGSLALGLAFTTGSYALPSQIMPFIILSGLQIFISNIICANLQAHLLTIYSPTLIMTFASFLRPLITSFYGILLFGETITWHFFASFVIVFIGLSLYVYSDKQEAGTSYSKSDI